MLRSPFEQFIGNSSDDSDDPDDNIEKTVKAAIRSLPARTHGDALLEIFGFNAPQEKAPIIDRCEAAIDNIEVGGISTLMTRPTSKGPSPLDRLIAAVSASLAGIEKPTEFVDTPTATQILIEELQLRDDLETEPAAGLLESDDSAPPLVPELFFAIARPIGTDTSATIERLWKHLESAKFSVVEIRLSSLIECFAQQSEELAEVPDGPPFSRALALMATGDLIRSSHQAGGATAALAINTIAAARPHLQDDAVASGQRGLAYIITNVMHRAEVQALQDLYGRRLFVLGIFGNDDKRLQALTSAMKHPGDEELSQARARAEALMRIDSGEQSAYSVATAQGLTFPQQQLGDGTLSLNSTFHLADVFVDSTRSDGGVKTIERLVDQIFSSPSGVLTRDELAMGTTYLNARRSSALSRQVGATLTTEDGEIIASGWNDVVRSGGKIYEDGDDPDHREHAAGGDPSDQFRVDTIVYFLNRLRDETTWRELGAVPEHLTDALAEFGELAQQLPEVSDEVVAGLSLLPNVSPSRLLNLIEFTRCVHAEMMAIASAARLGRSTNGAILYVTTFPCHECTRNIIAAGVTRVVFVEPYAKSLAPEFYATEIEVLTSPESRSGRGASNSTVTFSPYDGVSPGSFDRLFSWVARKHGVKEYAFNPKRKLGDATKWDIASADIRDAIKGYRNSRDASLFASGLVEAERHYCKSYPLETMPYSFKDMIDNDILKTSISSRR